MSNEYPLSEWSNINSIIFCARYNYFSIFIDEEGEAKLLSCHFNWQPAICLTSHKKLVERWNWLIRMANGDHCPASPSPLSFPPLSLWEFTGDLFFLSTHLGFCPAPCLPVWPEFQAGQSRREPRGPLALLVCVASSIYSASLAAPRVPGLPQQKDSPYLQMHLLLSDHQRLHKGGMREAAGERRQLWPFLCSLEIFPISIPDTQGWRKRWSEAWWFDGTCFLNFYFIF